MTYKGAKRAAVVLAAIPHDRPYWKPTALTWPPRNRCGAPATTAVTLSMWLRTSARSGIWDAHAVLDQTAANAGLLWRVTFWYIRYGKNLWGEHCPPLYMTTCRVWINKFFRSDLL